MVIGFPQKIYGNLVVLINYRGQHRIPYLPKKQVCAIRDARLRSIVKYAAETVPYYQNLFQREKINPREIRSVEDLDQLPFVDKEMVRKDPAQFIPTSREGKKSILFLTSGTTGMPIKIYHDRYSLLANIAFGEREREVVSRICGRGLGYRELYILYSRSTLRQVWDFYHQWAFIPIRPERLILSVSRSVEDIVEAINRFRPHIIVGYGSYLETFFKVLSFRRISMHLPKVVIYVSDTMTTEGRISIEQEFGITVLSQYNAVEAFKIGFFCEERKGFHLHEDLCHMKIINENGQKVVNGEKGQVVISNLVNRGTVLLNYRLGDVASMSSERCPCGRTLPLLSELEGRVEDIIFLPDGRFIHPRLIWEVMKQREEILKYQLIQHEPKRFELRLMMVNQEVYQHMVDRILADLHGLLGKSVIIESEYYEELKPQRGGKFRPVLSLCKYR